MSEEKTVLERGDDPRAILNAQVEAEVAAALEQVSLELTQAPPPVQGIRQWEVYARGPYQFPRDPAVDPGRIIFLGEKAYIDVVVWLNPQMCAELTAFKAKIELSFWTSNTQTMRPVPAMAYSCCIFTERGKCYYVTVWEFEPTEAACVLETNICARVCNCDNTVVPGYAGFVRHVYDFDPSKLFRPPPPGWGFDRPIRYMVADPDYRCDCDPDNPCP
ncbi:MAG: hypothetical protein IMY86_09925 [Chloroflexi bacterium]|nr:hypothetical protein [Chloroflexota bacterium]